MYFNPFAIAWNGFLGLATGKVVLESKSEYAKQYERARQNPTPSFMHQQAILNAPYQAAKYNQPDPYIQAAAHQQLAALGWASFNSHTTYSTPLNYKL